MTAGAPEARGGGAGSQGAAHERLLAAVLDHVTEHGVGDLTLRGLARAIGTSHRMLIYHFGSREGLVAEIVRANERRQRALLAELQLDPELPPVEVARRVWAQLADPAMWPRERLFFELYARALQGHDDAAPLLEELIEGWLAPATEDGIARGGLAREDARAEARLALAVVRGLLLDLLATGDRAGVDRAFERFLAARDAGGGREG